MSKLNKINLFETLLTYINFDKWIKCSAITSAINLFFLHKKITYEKP